MTYQFVFYRDDRYRTEVMMRRLLNIFVRLPIVLLVSQISVLVGAKLLAQPESHDPMTLYQTLMPDAPIGVLENFHCQTYITTDEEYRANGCRILLDDPHYVLVDVYVRNQTIEQVRFQVEDLRFGDLPQQWGRPLIEAYGWYCFARWHIDDYFVTAYLRIPIHEFTYWSPVSSVVISRVG
jgi:hypothetical protein